MNPGFLFQSTIDLGEEIRELSEETGVNPIDFHILLQLKLDEYLSSKILDEVDDEDKEEIVEDHRKNFVFNYFFNNPEKCFHSGIGSPTATIGTLGGDAVPIEGKCKYFLSPSDQKIFEEITDGKTKGVSGLFLCSKDDDSKFYYLPASDSSSGDVFGLFKDENKLITDYSCEESSKTCPLKNSDFVYKIEDTEEIVKYIRREIKEKWPKKKKRYIEKRFEEIIQILKDEVEAIQENTEEHVKYLESFFQRQNKQPDLSRMYG